MNLIKRNFRYLLLVSGIIFIYWFSQTIPESNDHFNSFLLKNEPPEPSQKELIFRMSLLGIGTILIIWSVILDSKKNGFIFKTVRWFLRRMNLW